MLKRRDGYWKEREQIPERKEYQRKYKRVYMKSYRKIHPQKRQYSEARRLWQKKRRDNTMKKILDVKIKKGFCDFCGWNAHVEILQFHHIDKSIKNFCLSRGNIGNLTWSKIEEEINKCKLLCPNCHLWLHYQETVNNSVPSPIVETENSK